MHISLTGHRPPKLAGYDLNKDYYKRLQAILEDEIEQACENNDQVFCHSGMALGSDTIWAKAIIQMKAKYPDKIQFVADIPDYNQPNIWPQAAQDLWTQLIAEADQVNTYVDKAKSYKHALMIRNIGMLQPADYVIAVYDGSSGGTEHAVKYAQKKSKLIRIINPKHV